MLSPRESLLDWNWEALRDLLTSWGEPSFRVEQVWRWIYRSLAHDLKGMRNLPATLRARLSPDEDAIGRWRDEEAAPSIV
jgi:23S rRNA (adenine2503-C2)-methyltransferase